MNFKTAFFITLATLLITNFIWLYIFVDRSVTYDYIRQEISYLKKDLGLIRNLMTDLKGTDDEEQIIKVLEKKYSDHVIKKDDGYLFVDDVGLKFESGKLAEIVFMNEL